MKPLRSEEELDRELDKLLEDLEVLKREFHEHRRLRMRPWYQRFFYYMKSIKI